MQYDEIRLTLQKVLSFPENLEKYLTTEQICDLIKLHYPSVWQNINNSFPDISDFPQILNQYTPSNFVASALKYYSINNAIPGLEQNELDIPNINSKEKSQNLITVWKLRKI